MPSQAPNTTSRVLEGAGGSAGGLSAELLPLVYDELRRLAAAQMRMERGGGAGQTLQPTALVHEAYLRVARGRDGEAAWNSRAHFFGAAATAMRRILVERARRRGRARRGGGVAPVGPDEVAAPGVVEPGVDMLALDEALTRLESHSAGAYRVVMLRYFAGLSIEETASALGVGVTKVKDEWAYARAWLHRAMGGVAGGRP